MFSSRTARTLLFALAIGILLIAFTAWLEAWQAQKAAPIGEVKSLALPTATTTPLPATATPTAQPAAMPTTIPVMTDINMAEGLPDGEVWLIVVLRADGKFDKYRLPAAQVRPYLDGDNPDINAYQAFLDSIVHLKVDESIIFANLADGSGRDVPPPDTPLDETPVPGPTNNAVPAASPNAPQPLYLPQVGN